jgi:hypothetical protein
MNKILMCGALAAAICASCASVPVPNDQKAASEASFRGAQEAGADNGPQAKLALQLSADELSQAKAAMAAGDNGRARDLFVRARLDAELAVGLAREGQAEGAAQNEAAQLAALQATP